MDQAIRLERLTEKNFEDFSSFLNCQDSGCYCSFWYQKWSSMEEWDQRKASSPELNKSCMLDKVRSKFHIGVLAYQGDQLVAWISVGPVPEFYWAWRRSGQLGDAAKLTACIPCITRKTSVRDHLPESVLLEALKEYGRAQGWTNIEGYPFDRSAIEQHGKAVTWPGFPEDFERAGFQRVDAHWLSSPAASRSIYRFDLNG